jgi:hypothetical protein
MNMDTTPYLKKAHYTDHLQSLQAACEWMNIERGRAARYGRLIREFFADGSRSREHILAHNESWEITDIYELWEASTNNFPGLKQKIKAVFSGGPVLREDERPDTSSNRPRIDAFVYLLAGKLIRAGVKVIAIDGIAAQGISCPSDVDIAFDWNGSAIDIECKRPQTQKAVGKRLREARQKLIGQDRQDRSGIIAVDSSTFIRPPEKLLGADSAEDAERFLAQSVEKAVTPNAKTPLGTAILGFLVFARAPAMIREGYSSIISPRGNPFTYMRPDCISTWLVIPNSRSSSHDALRFVFERLHRAMHSS